MEEGQRQCGVRVCVGPSCGGCVSTLRVGVWPSPRSAKGLGCAQSPRAKKGAVCTTAYRLRARHFAKKGVCHHMHHSTHTESALHSSAITRATHTCYRTRSLLGSQSKEVFAMRHARRGATRSAAQRSTARASSTCATETQCTHMHMCRAQSCRLVSPPPSTDHLPFCGGFGAQSPSCTAHVQCSGAWPSPRSAKGLGCASSPRAKKRSVSPHAPQHAHRERVALERNHARHAHVLRYRTRSLLGSQSKEVCE